MDLKEPSYLAKEENKKEEKEPEKLEDDLERDEDFK